MREPQFEIGDLVIYTGAGKHGGSMRSPWTRRRDRKELAIVLRVDVTPRWLSIDEVDIGYKVWGIPEDDFYFIGDDSIAAAPADATREPESEEDSLARFAREWDQNH